MRWKARQSFPGREGRLVLYCRTHSSGTKRLGLALVWLSARTLFPAEICSRDQIEFGRVRTVKANAGLSSKSWLPIQHLLTLLSICSPPRRCTSTAVLEPVVSHQQEVFHSIGCGDYSNTLRATRVVVALSSRNVKAMDGTAAGVVARSQGRGIPTGPWTTHDKEQPITPWDSSTDALHPCWRLR